MSDIRVVPLPQTKKVRCEFYIIALGKKCGYPARFLVAIETKVMKSCASCLATVVIDMDDSVNGCLVDHEGD